MNLLNIKRLAYEIISPEDLNRQLFSGELEGDSDETLVKKIVLEVIRKISV
jgi:hypothetical protein